MAAAALRRLSGGLVARTRGGSSCSALFLKHEHHPMKMMLVLRKQPLSPFFFTGQRKFHTAPVRGVLRLRPLHFLVATGGGYAGYRQYEKHKEKQLEIQGVEVPPKIAHDWQFESPYDYEWSVQFKLERRDNVPACLVFEICYLSRT